MRLESRCLKLLKHPFLLALPPSGPTTSTSPAPPPCPALPPPPMPLSSLTHSSNTTLSGWSSSLRACPVAMSATHSSSGPRGGSPSPPALRSVNASHVPSGLHVMYCCRAQAICGLSHAADKGWGGARGEGAGCWQQLPPREPQMRRLLGDRIELAASAPEKAREPAAAEALAAKYGQEAAHSH